MPTTLPRIQVTLDPELAAALDAVDPRPKSMARLIRDLALRGAREEELERDRYRAALDHLHGIATGDVDYDFGTSSEALAERDFLPDR